VLIGGKRYIHQQHIINNVITMTDATNSTIEFFIVVALFVFEALNTLMDVFATRNVERKKRVLPHKKTSNELNRMLKKDLVELVVAYQQ